MTLSTKERGRSFVLEWVTREKGEGGVWLWCGRAHANQVQQASAPIVPCLPSALVMQFASSTSPMRRYLSRVRRRSTGDESPLGDYQLQSIAPSSSVDELLKHVVHLSLECYIDGSR
jgi:hypothetical protein